MIKIGLIGEDPNDTESIKNLLTPQFKEKVIFKNICRNFRGGQLDSPKFFKNVKVEAKSSDIDFLLCIRDLDGFKSESNKVLARMKWFDNIKKETVDKDHILLLNIWELESIIFADIDLFNRVYGTKISFSKDPSSVKDPKERLKFETRNQKKKFVESDCKELFSQLDYSKIKNKCSFFKGFILELDSKISS